MNTDLFSDIPARWPLRQPKVRSRAAVWSWGIVMILEVLFLAAAVYGTVAGVGQ